MAKFVIGIYDDLDHALSAVGALHQAGFEAARTSLVMVASQPGELQPPDQGPQLGLHTVPGAGSLLAGGPLAARLAEGGLGAALEQSGVPSHPAGLYAQGVERGAVLVALTAPDERAQAAVELLNRFHPFDIERRSTQWVENAPPQGSDLQATDRPSSEGLAGAAGAAPVVPGMAPAEGGLPAESLSGVQVTGASGQWRDQVPAPRGAQPTDSQALGPSAGAPETARSSTGGTTGLGEPTAGAPDAHGQVSAGGAPGPVAPLPGEPTASAPIEQHEPNFGRRVHDLDPMGLRNEPRGESVPTGLPAHETPSALETEMHDPGMTARPDEGVFPSVPVAPSTPGTPEDSGLKGAPADAGVPIERHEPNFGRRVHDLDPVGLRSEPRGESVPTGLHRPAQENQAAPEAEMQMHDPGLHGEGGSDEGVSAGRASTGGAATPGFGETALGNVQPTDLLAHAGDPMPGLKPQPSGDSPASGLPVSEPAQSASGEGVAGDGGDEGLGGDEFEPLWRNHFDATYSGAPGDFDAYRPAYRFGFELAGDLRYKNQDWPYLEAAARRDWESDHPQQSWDAFQAAVRAGWHSVTGR